MSLALKFFKHYPEAILPNKAHTGLFEDAAYDLFYSGTNAVVLKPGDHYAFPTGLSCVIPEGFWLKFHGRSGLALKKGIQVLAGVIDAGYTGELKVILENTSNEVQIITPQSAVCQFTVEKITRCHITSISKAEFDVRCLERERGNNGFGSSGM